MLLLVVLHSVFAHTAATTENVANIDNAILGEPEVQCETSSVLLLFHTKNPFIGKIFVKGHVADGECVQVGDATSSHRFEVAHDACGVRRQREVNGVIISSTIIVSFHTIFITKIDRAYRVSCFYVEANKKVSNRVDVSALTTQLIEGQTQLPTCRYEILNEPIGAPIKYARIGDTVYHRWMCETDLEDVYCMKVHSCTVYDGQGGAPVTVIDSNGCSVDGVILQNIEYTGDLSAVRSAQVFKFADKAGLYFNCQILLTIKDQATGCESTPICLQTYVEPASRTTEVSSEFNGDSHESGYPTKPALDLRPSEDHSPRPPASHPSSPSPSPPPSASSSSTTSSPTAAELTPPQEPYPPTPDYSTDTSKATSLEPPEVESYTPGQNSTEQATTVPAYTDDGLYNRLIKRNILGETIRKKPTTVAEVDLPERGILVFGLEDVDGEDGELGHADARKLTSSKTCFNTTRMYALLVSVSATAAVVVSAFGYVVYKQRQLISNAFFKS